MTGLVSRQDGRPPNCILEEFPHFTPLFGERGSPISGRVMDRKEEKGKKKHSYLFRIYRQRAFLYHHTLTIFFPFSSFAAVIKFPPPFMGSWIGIIA